MTHTSAFKTPEGEAAYLAAYDEALKLWPAPYEEFDIPSQFGTTHVVAVGPTKAPPLVLLHGFMGTLLMWSPNIADFCQQYRVYAVDVMGHPNRSVPTVPVRDAADYLAWLTSTLDGLNLNRVAFAGMSFGSWLALNFAMTAANRVQKLALLCPAASLLPISNKFTLRAMLTALYPRRYWFNSLMAYLGFEDDPDNADIPRVLDLMYFAGMNFRMPPETRRFMPTVFSDDELQALNLPVLMLIGENEVIYDPAEALARARRLIPDFSGDLLPDCGHAMSLTQHEIVDARVLDFLNDD